MKKVTTGILAADTLLSAAPALAIDIGVGPDGIRVGPRYRDHEERYFRDRPYYQGRLSEGDHRSTGGSRVLKYRCD